MVKPFCVCGILNFANTVLLLTERLTGHIRQLSLKGSDVSNIDVKEGAELRNSQAHPRNGHIS